MVGRALVDNALKTKTDVSVRAGYFSQSNAFKSNPKLEIVQGDLRQMDFCRELCCGCQTGILAAASTGGAGQAVSEPWRQVNDNLIINAQLLEACFQEKVKRIILIGSATAYQDFEGKIKEEELVWDKNPASSHFGVGWVMRSLEKLAEFWHRTGEMEIILIRAANIYGPYGKFDPKNSNFIPALVRKAVDKLDPFEVWGSPDVTRDVIFREDFAEAVIGLLECEKIKFDIFNIGSGTAVTVDDVVKASLKYSKHNPSNIVYRSDRPVTVKNRILDCSKIKNLTNWEPRHSLDAGIQKTVEWWQENQHQWKR